MTPALTVIIPAYNVEDYVSEAICSIENQTFSDIEIIVVNDGSTDKTQDILEGFSKKPRVKIIKQNNSGTSQSRNTGLSVARGKYIGFLDGDDRWHPAKAARHIDVLERDTHIDLTFSRYRIIDDFGNDTGRRSKPPPRTVTIETLIGENIVGTTSNVVVRREALRNVGYFDSKLEAAVDLDLWIRFAELRRNNIHFIDKTLTDYRLRAGQISKDWHRVEQNWRKVIQKTMSKHPDLDTKIQHQALANFNRHLAYLAYESGDYFASRRLLTKALLSNPRRLLLERRTWFTIAAEFLSLLPVPIHKSLVSGIKDLRAQLFGRD